MPKHMPHLAINLIYWNKLMFPYLLIVVIFFFLGKITKESIALMKEWEQN